MARRPRCIAPSSRLVARAVLASVGIVSVLAGCGAEPAPKPEPESPSRNVSNSDGKESGLKLTPVDTSRLLALPYFYELEQAFPALDFQNQRPLQLLTAPGLDDRLFVLCQEGMVYTFSRPGASDSGATNKQLVDDKTLFLDLTDRVSIRGNEEGLLGLAFHPDFAQNRQFFASYSADDEQGKPRLIVSRLLAGTERAARADADSEQILLEVPQTKRTQNGGSLEFGPDGYLYIGLGDGGSTDDPQRHGQNLATLPGSILRIDVDTKTAGESYAIPEDNPFVDRDDARGEIWAYGFRNIWRLAFDSKTGTLWAGDVGQHRFEEINVVKKGGNYGWSDREANYAFRDDDAWSFPQSMEDRDAAAARYIDPVASYYHSEGQAVIGGRVYRGTRLPELQGAYLYTDFFSGNIWALLPQEDGGYEDRLISNSGMQIAGFGEDQAGEIYLCSFDGKIYQLKQNENFLAEGKRRFPAQLSQTGLFSSTKNLTPVAGAIPYAVNVSLWSDHAIKSRFIALPERGKVKFSESGHWQFPVGTVAVKTFFLDTTRHDPETRVRLETRLMVHGPLGWEGYTYHWNDEQTDAVLFEAATSASFDIQTDEGQIRQDWYFPSRSDCKVCHTKAGGFVLSLNTRQLNRQYAYATGEENQLEHWSRLGVFDAPLPKDASEIEAYPDWEHAADDQTDALARAYLDVNCAFCHAPGGPGNSPIDLRYHTPLNRTAMIGRAPRGTRAAGPPASSILTPQRPGDSELLRRMEIRGPGQMPILATSLVDEQGIQRLRKWIKELSMPR